MYEDLGSFSFQDKYPEGVHVDQFSRSHAWGLKSEFKRPSQMHLDVYFDSSLCETAWILTLGISWGIFEWTLCKNASVALTV